MSGDDIVWGRGGGRRVPKGTRAGEALAELEAMRQGMGGDLRGRKGLKLPDDLSGQLDLFEELYREADQAGPPLPAPERES